MNNNDENNVEFNKLTQKEGVKSDNTLQNAAKYNVDDKFEKSISSDQINKIKLDEKVEQLIEKKVSDEGRKIINDFEKKITTDKASLISVFGIFASILAFLSVEIQLFKVICSIEKALGFTILLLGSLLLFNVALHHLATTWINNSEDEKHKRFPWKYSVCVFIIFVVGAILSTYGNEEKCRDSLIYQKYELMFNDRFLSLKKEYNDKINNIEKKAENNGDDIVRLKKSENK